MTDFSKRNWVQISIGAVLTVGILVKIIKTGKKWIIRLIHKLLYYVRKKRIYITLEKTNRNSKKTIDGVKFYRRKNSRIKTKDYNVIFRLKRILENYPPKNRENQEFKK